MDGGGTFHLRCFSPPKANFSNPFLISGPISKRFRCSRRKEYANRNTRSRRKSTFLILGEHYKTGKHHIRKSEYFIFLAVTAVPYIAWDNDDPNVDYTEEHPEYPRGGERSFLTPTNKNACSMIGQLKKPRRSTYYQQDARTSSNHIIAISSLFRAEGPCPP